MTGREDTQQSSASMTCAEVIELAGLFVLDALEAKERAAVLDHLATCPELHEEIAQLGGVVPALASLAEPLDAPPELKALVLAAVGADAGAVWAPQAERSPMSAVPVPASRQRRIPVGETSRPPVIELAARRTPTWISWGAALAAVLVLAVVGVWAVDAQSRADRVSQRAAVLADALEVLADPQSAVAILRASATEPTAGGFAAFSADGTGYLVLAGLDAPPTGRAYQAWYIVDGSPASAGLLTVDADGYGVLTGIVKPVGTDQVALTIEPQTGSIAPTSAPFIAGDVREGV